MAQQDRQLSIDIEATRLNYQQKREANEEAKAAALSARKARQAAPELTKEEQLRLLTADLRLDEKDVRQSTRSPSVRVSKNLQS